MAKITIPKAIKIKVPAMPILKLKFPGGRYHATPWGHHVNEGLVEWPPSPWRLLRALLACGFSTQGWLEVPDVAKGLIKKLAEVLPSYHLPEASLAHSRHYMPYLEGANQKTTLVFDTWANIGDGEIFIHWPCQLELAELGLFAKLATNLGYLGRSESWVEVQFANATSIEENAMPCLENNHPGLGWEQVSLMAAIPPNDYLQWCVPKIQEALKPFQNQKLTAPVKKKQQNAVEPYPEDLLSCLSKDTVWWKGQGWSQPPGSRRVLYWRRCNALQVGVPQLSIRPGIANVNTMLLAITTPSGNCSALPPTTRTLPQAELFHRAIVGRVGKGQPVHCPELTGRDTKGSPLRGNRHEHAHTLPLDLDGDGRIDHLMIHAKMGLGNIAQQAIRTLRRTWTKGGIGELQLALVGSGDRHIFRKLPGSLGLNMEKIVGPTNGAQVWKSVTPFVPPRFVKTHGKNSLFGQINSELESRNLPAIIKFEFVLEEEKNRNMGHFVRLRRNRKPPPVNIGYCLKLFFPNSIQGPLSLGYASHFGLGLFQAVEE